jgi:hypothetical protein
MIGFLSGSDFGWKVAWRLGIFLVLTLGFPFIIYGIVLACGAHHVRGASGAMAVVVGVFLKPVIIVAFLIAMISPSWKRARSLGIFPLWGLMIPLLFAMDYTYLFAAGNFWGASFSMGILTVQTPMYAMTALVLIVAMVIAGPPSGDEPNGLSRFGGPGQVFKTFAIVVLVVGLVTSIYSALTYGMILFGRVEQLVPLNRSISKYLLVFWKAKPFVCVVFSALALWIAFISRRHGAGKSSLPPKPSGVSPAVLARDGAPRSEFGQRK